MVGKPYGQVSLTLKNERFVNPDKGIQMTRNLQPANSRFVCNLALNWFTALKTKWPSKGPYAHLPA